MVCKEGKEENPRPRGGNLVLILTFDPFGVTGLIIYQNEDPLGVTRLIIYQNEAIDESYKTHYLQP